MNRVTVAWNCPACETETNVEVSFPRKFRRFGPKEMASETSIDPADCPNCGEEFDRNDLVDAAIDQMEDAK